MIKVQVLTQCEHCNGEAYLPMGEAEDCQGHKYTRYVQCPFCEGTGSEPKWIDGELIHLSSTYYCRCIHLMVNLN